MQGTPARWRPLPGLGMTSLVLGHIALLLFFLPILGIPLAACGLTAGLAALVCLPLAPGATSLRWSLAGIAVSCLALGANLAIDRAPAGYFRSWPAPPAPWQAVPDRPWVPPPAHPQDLE